MSVNKFNDPNEANKLMELAIGRILNIGSRPFQEGDIQLYEQAKWAFIDGAEYLGLKIEPQQTTPKAGWNFGNSVSD